VSHGHVANNTFTNCNACNGKQGNAVVIDGHQKCDDPRAAYMEHIMFLGYPFKTKRRRRKAPRCLRTNF
jgi:hypothetical protein